MNTLTQTRSRLALAALLLIALTGCSATGPSDEQNVPWDTVIPPSENFDASYPTWGPEGKRIAFQHTLPDSLIGAQPGAINQLWTANLETGERRMVAPGPIVGPDGSPDGRWFVFHSQTDPEFLYKIQATGDSLMRLTGPGSPNPELEYTASGRWSPSGDRILFTVAAGEPRGNAVMKSDGSSARILVPYGITGAWMPGGEHFVYANWDTTQTRGTRMEVYMAKDDGSHIRQLTNLPNSDIVSQPIVSPDAKSIAFAYNGRDGISEIYLMNADGTNIRQVTQGPGTIRGVSWHPDGDRIVFGRFIPNVLDRIYFLDVETLEVTPVFPK